MRCCGAGNSAAGAVYAFVMENAARIIAEFPLLVEPLTARERQIADAIARGLTNKQIGAELDISAETVKRHLGTIYSKLALPGRVALAIHVLQSRAA